MENYATEISSRATKVLPFRKLKGPEKSSGLSHHGADRGAFATAD
jgi:hypothetical protein